MKNNMNVKNVKKEMRTSSLFSDIIKKKLRKFNQDFKDYKDFNFKNIMYEDVLY